MRSGIITFVVGICNAGKEIKVTGFWEKYRKQLFWLIIAASFFMIYAYNFLTPYWSDDYAYLMDVSKADSLGALVKQQYGEYLSNSGRVIGQFNVRLSLTLFPLKRNVRLPVWSVRWRP